MSKADNKNYFYHSDALGSIAAITDDTNILREAYTYKAYGQPAIMNARGQLLPGSTVGNIRLFTAREYEREAGLYNNRHRYLDPMRGAFTQEDPILFNSQTINLFAYASNSPILGGDALGLYAAVVVKNAKVYITLPVEFTGPGLTPELVSFFKDAIERYWTGKFGKFDVETTVVLDSKSKNRNTVSVSEGSGITPMTTPDGHSYWYSDTTDWQAAHEAAHLMGAPDEYDYKTKLPFVGWEHDMPSTCGSPVTEKTMFKVIQYALAAKNLTIP